MSDTNKFMQIPATLLLDLAPIKLKVEEWRVLMVIISDVYNDGEGCGGMDAELGNFVKKTGISKPHVCRALSALEEMGFIQRVKYRGGKTICFNPDKNTWEV